MIKLKNIYNNIKLWILYRTTHKYHIVNSELKPGYYDTDEIMLFACFSLLKKYVEKELSWMQIICNKNERKKIPWWMPDLIYRDINAKKLGLKYLDFYEKISDKERKKWCISAKSLKEYKKSHKEIKELYIWWMNTRPNRKDPYKECYEVGKDYMKAIKRNSELMNAFEIEELQRKEDDDMLIRLMNVRKNLWT